MLLLVLVLSSAIASASGIASCSAGAILSCALCRLLLEGWNIVLLLVRVRLVQAAAGGLSCTAV